ncbi:MAG: glycosyltransferase [Deltaproteobacteria bacterium]|nr:glycosyltransferase [Deltaproteobacteria bacterium]
MQAAQFALARLPCPVPLDQLRIPGPRIGYLGAIDPLLDLDLIVEVARRRPDWHLVLAGPIAGLARWQVPTRPNIHRLACLRASQVPEHVSDWDVAILPFKRTAGEAMGALAVSRARELLVAGRPVVATSVPRIVQSFGRAGVVRIADGPSEMVGAIEDALAGRRERGEWLARVDSALAAQASSLEGPEPRDHPGQRLAVSLGVALAAALRIQRIRRRADPRT